MLEPVPHDDYSHIINDNNVQYLLILLLLKTRARGNLAEKPSEFIAQDGIFLWLWKNHSYHKR